MDDAAGTGAPHAAVRRGRPSGILRAFLRFPVVLYRLGLGPLFGQRFLLLEHVGRATGKKRRTVIEVLRRDPASGAASVAAAWGERSDWYRNVRRQPAVRLTIGRSTFHAVSRFPGPADGAVELAAYARRYPTAFRALTRTLTGQSLPPTEATCLELAQSVPIVRFEPTDSQVAEAKG